MKTALFERFEIQMSEQAALDCSHAWACDDDVAYWADHIECPEECTPEAARAELSEYGAWSDEELSDSAQNWRRLVWLAACDIKEQLANQ